ncbi:hypothetical protein ABE504_06335 [Paenibacillus oryzisoli]
MTVAAVIVPLFTHLIPILFLGFKSIDVLIRNLKKLEHRLLSVERWICC